MRHTTTIKNNGLNQFEAIFDNATMGILIMNHSGKITAINPFALKKFGYTKDELIGKRIEALIPSRFQRKHVQHRRKYSKETQSRPMGVGMDLYALKKDGTEFPVEVSLGNYQNNDKKFVIEFITDITIRKKTAAEIEKLNNKLEATVELRTRDLTRAMHELERSKEELSKLLEKEKELSELKSRFVSMASHEFRTPLSTVLSSTYLIEKYTSAEDQPKREKHLHRIVSSVTMLTDILNDFLSVGKIEEGKIQVRPTTFNVQELVIAMARDMKNSLKKDQKIHCYHEGKSVVLLDPSLLKHIMQNLISNASKFSPEASSIEIKTVSRNDRIILSVKDYGMGISKEDQQHLMERFFRGTNVSAIQGTGLGLHIVSKYAELMNGAVVCKSELEKGTEFIITFNTKGG